MMTRWSLLVSLGILAGLCMPAITSAQEYPSAIVDFEDGDYGDTDNKEMFWDPEWSGSTRGIVANETANDENNWAYRSTAFGSAPGGGRSLQIGWTWEDAFDEEAWVRFTTFNAPERPNPSLDTRGKVLFKIKNISGAFLGNLRVCIGIRESGVDVPQLFNGGTSGGVEWVGVKNHLSVIEAGSNGVIDTTPIGADYLIDTNGVQYIVGGGADHALSTTPAVDDVANYGYFVTSEGTRVPIPVLNVPPNPNWRDVEFDLTAMTVTYNGSSQPMWITSFALANGILDPDNDRGVLDAINFINDTSDSEVEIAFGLDDIQFIATVEDPTTPPAVEGPIYVDETSVNVTGVYDGIDRVVLMLNGTTNGLPVTINTNGITEVLFPIAAAVEGDVFTAKQRFGANQKWSLDSAPVVVETVPFPGPYIRPPVDGGTTVMVGGLDPAASEIEVFLNTNGGEPWKSLGTAAPGDVEVFEFTLPEAVLMGQELRATQTISGGTSDAGYPVIVTTNGLTEHFYDDFEGYANQAAFEAAWVDYGTYTQLTLVDNMSATDGAATRKSAYSPGSSERCQRFITETPLGTDTHPLVWSFHFFDERIGNPNQYADLRRTIPAEPGGSWSKIYEFGSTSWVAGTTDYYQARLVNGPNWFSLDLDDESTDDRPATRSEGWHTMTAVIKTSTIDYYVDGILSEYGRPTGGDYQFNHLVLGSGSSSSGGAAWYDDVRLTTGAVEFPAIAAQPPRPPTVVAPIIPLTTTITVTDINTNADSVTLYWDQGAPDTMDPAGMDTVEFTVAGGANAGDVYWATQTVAGLESPPSESVTVLLPAPVIHHAPADNAGAASTVTVTWVDPAANLVTIVLNTNGAELTAVPTPGAFTVDVPVPAGWLTVGDKVAAKMRIGTIDSVWSAEETITVGTETVRFYDTMEAYADHDDFENDNGPPREVRDTGWWPSSGDPGLTLVDDMNTTISGSQAVYCPSGMSPPAAGWGDGYQSNFDFLYPEPDWPVLETTDTNPIVWSVSIYDAGGAGADNGRQWVELRDYSTGSLGGIVAMGMPGSSFFSTIDLDYYSARVYGGGPGYVNLDGPGAPTRTLGWHKLTAVIKPASVDFYVDGVLAKKAVSPKNHIVYDNLYMGSGYDAGVIGYYDDFKVHNGAFSIPDIEVQAPLPPVLVGPVEAGDLFVTVEGVVGDATDVDIYANGSTAIGHLDITTNGTTFEVPVTALVHLDSITAKQSNVVGESAASNALEVGMGNGVFSLGLGIRETGDVVALGTPGGTTGDIELVNVTTNALGIRSGIEITPQNAWQTIEFDPANGVDGFTGNGVIDGTRGTFEHLALFVSDSADRSAGVFELYVDNVVNVDADGLGDFLITDFEGYNVYDEVLLTAPHISGSTSGYLSVPPSLAGIRNIVPPVDGTSSVLISWNWKNTDGGAWVRDTTSSADYVNRPVIDITKPVRMDVLLPVSCLVEAGDLDEDGTIDINDFQYFPACLSGPGVLMGTDCECADLDGDLDVDLADFGVYQNLLE